MLSKEERRAFNTAFWNGFKKYSKKAKSANDRRVNWANYPTGIKQIHIRLYADAKRARFSIDIQDKDEGIRAIIWEQFTELKKVLEDEFEVPGNWEESDYNSAGQTISSISWVKEGVNIYNEEDHPKIYEFLLDKAVRFDRFYNVYNEILFALTK